MRGRSLATEVWPYSFSEWLSAYLEAGGFPEVRGLDALLRLRILQDHVAVVVFRDVVERHGIANLPLARYLTRTLLRNVGRSLSPTKLHNDLRSQGRLVSKDALHAYGHHFEDAFLGFAVPLHDASPRKAETAPKKIYGVDPGLIAAFRLGAEDLGRRFENLVYLDLRSKGCELAYYLTASRREVDFLVRHPDGRQELIQVCWDLQNPETLQREQEALDEARAELGLEGRILTMASYLESAYHDPGEPGPSGS